MVCRHHSRRPPGRSPLASDASARSSRARGQSVLRVPRTHVYRFMYSSDVNGSASEVSRIRLSFMMPSYDDRSRAPRQFPTLVARARERLRAETSTPPHLHPPPSLLQRHRSTIRHRHRHANVSPEPTREFTATPGRARQRLGSISPTSLPRARTISTNHARARVTAERRIRRIPRSRHTARRSIARRAAVESRPVARSRGRGRGRAKRPARVGG